MDDPTRKNCCVQFPLGNDSQVTAAELALPWALDAGVRGAAATAPGRVAFTADTLAAGYAAALCLHSATRVLQLLSEQDLDVHRPGGDTVYEAARAAGDWASLLAPQQTLGVHCLHVYGNSTITNSQLVTRRVRDAVCDAVRDARCGGAMRTMLAAVSIKCTALHCIALCSLYLQQQPVAIAAAAAVVLLDCCSTLTPLQLTYLPACSPPASQPTAQGCTARTTP
jgi:hypothetical protein